MTINYVCNECSTKYSPYDFPYICECGGMLNLENYEKNFSMDEIIRNEWSLFRYLNALPFQDSDVWKDVTMGEGLTSLVRLYQDNPDILVKMDYMMPTLSFKDRGAAVLIAKAKEFGAKKVIQDSSGNGGNSIAAYANRVGMECDIFVPEGTSPKKISMIKSHGANIHVIPGSREDTAKAALDAVKSSGAFYASHVYNPYFYEGTKTYVYEIFEQLGGNMVDTLVIPVGNGTLLLGAYFAVKELYEFGLIDKLPRIIGVQASGCSPIYKAFKEGEDTVEEVVNTGTAAEGIAIAAPKRGKQVLEAIRETNGDIILAPEEDIIKVQDELARKGFYVEITTAATFAAFNKYYKDNKDLGKVVLPFCGAGLKSSK
ncbi:MAG: threonine synthase [Tissierellaceae bacterium]|nr:threonine synthase [Tissierellaceae bacterium]